MNDSAIQDLIELARMATEADFASFVLIDHEERVELWSPSPSGQGGVTHIDQPVEPMMIVQEVESGSQTVAVAPITGPAAQAGWIGVIHQDPVASTGSTDRSLQLVTQIARLIEQCLDRSAEQVRLDEVGDLLRTNQERLHATRDELTMANRELEQFAYIAAHELVSPLRAVAAYAEILESVAPGAADDEAAMRNCVNEIRSGVQLMTRQVQALLELANNQLDAESVNAIELGAVVNAALDTLALRLDEVDATVNVDELPLVLAAPIPLQSVFANLITNAIRYRSPDRSLRIDITATPIPGGNRIEVADNGTGVDEVDRARIFGMFERASTSEDGSGIGLALSRRIVNLFDAKIGIAEDTGEGSVFWLEFPEVGIEGLTS